MQQTSPQPSDHSQHHEPSFLWYSCQNHISSVNYEKVSDKSQLRDIGLRINTCQKYPGYETQTDCYSLEETKEK